MEDENQLVLGRERPFSNSQKWPVSRPVSKNHNLAFVRDYVDYRLYALFVRSRNLIYVNFYDVNQLFIEYFLSKRRFFSPLRRYFVLDTLKMIYNVITDHLQAIVIGSQI